jgi:hypothetical protein
VLLEQRYSLSDDLAHIRALIRFFFGPPLHSRHGPPVSSRSIERPSCPTRKGPLPLEARGRTRRAEGPVPRSSRKSQRHNESGDPRNIDFDSSLEFEPRFSALGCSQIFRRKWWYRHKLRTGEAVFRDNVVFKYEDRVRRDRIESLLGYPRIPCVCPGWDNSPRRKTVSSFSIQLWSLTGVAA